MGAVLELSISLHTISCGECGGTYAINERYREQKATKGGGWHCPYCQVDWGYFKNNENARLKRELADERQRKDRALAEANGLRISAGKARAAAERLRKRVSNGVCPCCNRSFVNLQRHMKTKHPEEVKA